MAGTARAVPATRVTHAVGGDGGGSPGRAARPGERPGGIPPHRVSEPAQVRAARPASSRATGMRNGEQET
nr:hypothetical protein GCM10017588_25590 [Microbispora rosea subsp. aerata]